MSAEHYTEIVTKFAIASMMNMIRAMARIVHLNLGDPISMLIARTIFPHTQ